MEKSTNNYFPSFNLKSIEHLKSHSKTISTDAYYEKTMEGKTDITEHDHLASTSNDINIRRSKNVADSK